MMGKWIQRHSGCLSACSIQPCNLFFWHWLYSLWETDFPDEIFYSLDFFSFRSVTASVWHPVSVLGKLAISKYRHINIHIHLMKPIVKRIWGRSLAFPLNFCLFQAIVALYLELNKQINNQYPIWEIRAMCLLVPGVMPTNVV